MSTMLASQELPDLLRSSCDRGLRQQVQIRGAVNEDVVVGDTRLRL